MRILIFTLTVLFISCNKTPQPPVAEPSCYGFKEANGFFDGESVWWYEEDANNTFSGNCSLAYDECELLFQFSTKVQVCDYFKITNGAFPDVCPFSNYSWQWDFDGPNGMNSCLVHLDEQVADCTSCLGQNKQPYTFHFRIFYVPETE